MLARLVGRGLAFIVRRFLPGCRQVFVGKVPYHFCYLFTSNVTIQRSPCSVVEPLLHEVTSVFRVTLRAHLNTCAKISFAGDWQLEDIEARNSYVRDWRPRPCYLPLAHLPSPLCSSISRSANSAIALARSSRGCTECQTRPHWCHSVLQVNLHSFPLADLSVPLSFLIAHSAF
jgi:hypothetical protein